MGKTLWRAVFALFHNLILMRCGIYPRHLGQPARGDSPGIENWGA
ncbi:hypothetical protein AB7M35_001304 [Amorphus suaedae]